MLAQQTYEFICCVEDFEDRMISQQRIDVYLNQESLLSIWINFKPGLDK